VKIAALPTCAQRQRQQAWQWQKADPVGKHVVKLFAWLNKTLQRQPERVESRGDSRRSSRAAVFSVGVVACLMMPACQLEYM
jgi:hypothetical protein